MFKQTEIVAALLMIACLYLFYKNRQAIKLTNQLKVQTAHLKNMNQFKGEALSNISHEIRTPISAILGVQEKILRSKSLPMHEERILVSAHASAYSMLDILNQVLDAEKIAKGKLQLKEEPCDLKNLLKHIERTFSESANSKNILFSVTICSEIAESLMIDSTRLGQVIHNLLSNAIKQTDTGQITLVTRVLANDHYGQMIYFELSDTGSGMTPDDIDRLRQPYEQNLQNINQFSQLGSGLGLPITEQLLILMGSSLTIESEPNLGSSFSFSLALKRSIDQPKYGVIKNSFESPMDPSPTNQTVLVVDDHTSSRLITETQFKDMGYCVHSLSNASEAIQLMSNHQFDILITDFSMPGMNGYEFARLVRNSEYGKDIQIYGITAHTDGAKELLKEECHFDNVLIKPVSIKDWQREIHLKKTYIESLKKLTTNDLKIYKIIAEEVFVHQSSTIEQLLPHLSQSNSYINEIDIQTIAHKILGGAKLTNDEILIKICERLSKKSNFITPNSLADLCIAIKKSNKVLKKILENL
jgi:two-component system sensor histidine kinase EvgS